jgi:hypothetical protein
MRIKKNKVESVLTMDGPCKTPKDIYSIWPKTAVSGHAGIGHLLIRDVLPVGRRQEGLVGTGEADSGPRREQTRAYAPVHTAPDGCAVKMG